MKINIMTLLMIHCSLLIANAQWSQMTPFGGETACSISANGNYIFAGTNNYGIYRTSNNGVNWSPNGYNAIIYSLVVNGNYIFGGANTIYGIYRSTDNGNHWNNSVLNNKAVLSLAISGNNIFAGTNYQIYVSSNNGDNWSQTTMNSNGSVFSLVVSGNYIFAGLQAYGVYLSTNNGSTWIQRSLNNKTIYSLAANGSIIYAGTEDSGVYISTDYGNTWNQTSLNDKTVRSLIVNGNNIIAGTAFYGIYLSTNSGQSWTQKNQGFAITPTVLCLLIANNYIFAGTDGQSVWRRPYADIIGIKQISEQIPQSYLLHQNFPNPFNPSTIIRYELPINDFVKIYILNSLGQKIETLVNEKQLVGIYEVTYDGTNLPSGIYFYKLETASYTKTKKMILLK